MIIIKSQSHDNLKWKNIIIIIYDFQIQSYQWSMKEYMQIFLQSRLISIHRQNILQRRNLFLSALQLRTTFLLNHLTLFKIKSMKRLLPYLSNIYWRHENG